MLTIVGQYILWFDGYVLDLPEFQQYRYDNGFRKTCSIRICLYILVWTGNIKKFQCLNEQISYIHVFNEGFLSTVLKSAFLNEYIQQQFVFVLF